MGFCCLHRHNMGFMVCYLVLMLDSECILCRLNCSSALNALTGHLKSCVDGHMKRLRFGTHVMCSVVGLNLNCVCTL